jgi:hypothetical protein
LNDNATRYSAPALEKGLDIIELLVGHPEGLSLAELAKELGRTTAEIFRWKRAVICRLPATATCCRCYCFNWRTGINPCARSCRPRCR